MKPGLTSNKKLRDSQIDLEFFNNEETQIADESQIAIVTVQKESKVNLEQ